MSDIVPKNTLKEQPGKEMRMGKKRDSGSIERVHKNLREIQLTELWEYIRGSSPDIISHPQREKTPTHTR